MLSSIKHKRCSVIFHANFEFFPQILHSSKDNMKYFHAFRDFTGKTAHHISMFRQHIFAVSTVVKSDIS